MRNSTLFLKRTMLLASLGFWTLFLFMSSASFAQSGQTSVLVDKMSPLISSTVNYNVPVIQSGPFTTFDENDCGQETPSNDAENGLGNLHILQFANDFTVNPNEIFNLDSISFNILTEFGQTINAVDIYFYEDSGNGPGEEMSSMLAVTPTANESIGEAFDFDLREVTFEFEDPISFTGSSSESIYWVGILLDYSGASSYMEVTTITNTPNQIYYFDNDTQVWLAAEDDPTFDEIYDGVMSLYGECIELEGCTGQPDAGHISGGETMEICKSIGFSLSVSGSTPAADLIYQWQEKLPEEEDWTDIEDANDGSLQVSNGITEDTEYRLRVECENSEEFDFTDSITVTVKSASECFCTPTYSTGCTSGDQISNVTLTGESEIIDNDSQCSPGAYGDYTDQTPADLAPGETYTLSVSTDYGSPTAEEVRAWIDYNGNGTFEDGEEIAYTQGNGLPSSGTGEFDFTVPENVEPGEYRMRVKLDYNGSDIQPCGSATYGETEDYTVEIIELEDCEEPITAGEIADTELDVCGGIAFTLSVTGASDPANGLTRQWQSSPTGEDDWTDVEGAHANTYTFSDGVDVPTDFRYKVVCNDGDPDYTGIIEISLNPAQECYCVPEGTNSNYYINNFSTTGAVDDITNMNSGFSTGGYGDFTDMILSQENTGEVSFEVDIVGSTSGFKVWVDWNQDGQFSADEVVYQSTAYANSHSGSFTVPEDADPGQTRMRIVNHWLSATGDADPCETGYTNGEFEDYTFDVIELEDCEGMPSAGTPDEDELLVCAGIAFTVSVSDASGAANNLYRRWQSSPTGEDDWTNIAGSGASTFVIQDGVFEDTDFRYAQTCNEEDSDYSDIIEVNLKPGNECYCTPTYTYGCISNDRISNVSLTGESNVINNDSGCSDDDYGDYTDLTPADLAPGETYTLSVSTDYGSPTSENVRAWIDYNHNGNFEDSEEIAYTQGSGLPSSGTGEFEFTVPENVEPGNYRMRVRLVYGSGSDIPACGNENHGETEDYTVEIIELEDCEGPVNAGIVEEDFTVCASIPFTISVSDASDPANGLERQWQSSPMGEDDWTDMEGAHSNIYTVSAGIDEPTDFRYKVVCDGDESDISDTISVTLNPAIECYCIPGGTSSSYYINNFTTTGGEQNIENLNSGYSDDGYGDFTETHTVSAAHTQPVGFTADYVGTTFGTKIWVDWNQDGQFGEDEIVFQSSSYESSEQGSFNVPESAVLGTTRMRIGISSTPSTGPNDPCEVGTREFEDYSFEVLALEDCEGMPSAGTLDEDELLVCAGMPFTVSVSDATGAANNLYRRWQSSPAGEEDWADITGANSPDYTVQEGIEEPTDFRYVLTCNEEDTDISDTVSVTLKPALECYCVPENTSSSTYFISNVSTEGALQDIDNETEFSDNGYEDYSDSQVIIVYPGQTFDFTVTGSSTSMYYAIWLDIDQNGNFDGDSEKIAESDSYISPPFTGSFEVPADFEEGSYRLRIRSTWSPTNIGPCEDNGYGETEDYTLQVIFPDCFPPVNITVDYITDVSAQVNWDANDETSWVLTYGETGFDPATGGDSIDVNGIPSADLLDLNDDTTYDVYVKTICDEDEESVLIGPVKFTTNITPPSNTRLCDAIPLEPNNGCIGGPYSNIAAFEEAGEPIGSCHNDYRGTNTVWFTFTAPGDGEVVITTNFNSTEIQTEIVVFEAPIDCEDMATLGEEVGCANANDAGIVELEGLTPGETYYVKVGGFNNTEGLFCIEVQMDETPVCLAPSEITIGDIIENTVEVSWTANGTATQWEVIYGLTGFDPEADGDSEIVSTTSTTLTGLIPVTDYDVYVRALCGQNNNSVLAGPEVFTTEPMSVDNQIFNDFTFYPNPVKDQLTLKAGTTIEKVEVFNLLGQSVMELQPNTLETNVNTEKLQSGVYLMNVTLNGNQKSFRVVKK